VTLRRRIRFYQQLAVLTRAGIPLRTGLARLREKMHDSELAILSDKISLGQSLGDAFFAAGFSPFESHLVTAGERSAQLETVLQHLSEFWQRQRQMVQALTNQLSYPLLILILSLMVGALVDFMFKSWGVAVAHLVESVVMYGSGFTAVYLLVRGSWNTEMAQTFWLYVPLVGRTLATSYSYRWITAMKLEYSAGIPLPDAVADAWLASGFAGAEKFAEEGRRTLREGAELSTLLHRWKKLPRDWVDFVETGEVSGALETAFANLEAEAGRAWDQAEKHMTQWVPKIIYFFALLIVVLQIGVIALNLFQHLFTDPMNDINSALNN
jgi:type II secretory pathway component PulF